MRTAHSPSGAGCGESPPPRYTAYCASNFSNFPSLGNTKYKLIAEAPHAAGVLLRFAAPGRVHAAAGTHPCEGCIRAQLCPSPAPPPAHRAGEIDTPPKRQYRWIADMDDALAAALHALPFSLRLPPYRALVVHAGLVPGTPLRSQRLTDILNLRGLLTEEEAARQSAGRADQQQQQQQQQRRQGCEAGPAAATAEADRQEAAGAAAGGAAAADSGLAGSSAGCSAAAEERLSNSGSNSSSISSSSSSSSSGLSDGSGLSGADGDGSSALWSMSSCSSMDEQETDDPGSASAAAADSVLIAQLGGALAAYELVASIPLSTTASSAGSSGSGNVGDPGNGDSGSSSSGGGGAGAKASAHGRQPMLQQQRRQGPERDSPLLLVRPKRSAAAEEDAGTLFARPPQNAPRRRWVGDREGGHLWAAQWQGPEHLFYGHDARRVSSRGGGVVQGKPFGRALTLLRLPSLPGCAHMSGRHLSPLALSH